MNTNKSILNIIIKYENKKFKLETEEIISYEDLKQKAINYFDINKNKEEFLEFIYLDEDNDKNILGCKDKIFEVAKEIDNDNYLIELNLILSEYDKTNENNIIYENNENNKNNEIIIEKKEEDINNNKFLEKIENKEIKNIENKYNYRLNKLHLLYKNRIKNIKEEIIRLINSKCNDLEKMIKVKIDNPEKYLENVNIENINKEIINIENINKENIIMENNYNLINEDILDKKDKSNMDNNTMHIEHSLIAENEVINISTDDREKDYNIINKDNNNIENIDSWYNVEENKIDNIKDKELGKRKKSGFLINNIIKKIKPNAKINSPLDKIKNIFKKLEKEKSDEAFIDNVKKILAIMKKENISKKQINDYMIKYIFDPKKISKKEKIQYYMILKKINYLIEIEKINEKIYQSILKLLEKENKVYDENIEETYKSLNKENLDNYLREKITEIINKRE